MPPKNIHIGDESIPLSDFCVARTGVLGITRSGKTYAAKGIAEQLMDAGIPIVVFDAIGVWRFLKTPGDGPNALGYPIVVAGGEQPDLPLTPQSAAEIVRAAMRENVSLVIDLYDAKLSKADWRRIVQSCFRTLLYENKSVRHIFLEEAAEYAPQKIMDGETYAEVEKLVRMGGNKGLGITLINQRAQELNKAVLELCDNLVLLRQRGSHAIDSLEKWLDRTSPDMAKEIATSLPHMTQGDAWIWTEASERPVRTKTKTIRSFHPDRRTTGAAETSRQTVDSGKFVAKLSGELAKVIEETKANDPAELKRRIAALERQLASKAPAPAVKVERVDVPVLKDEHVAALKDVADKFHAVSVVAEGSSHEIRQAISVFMAAVQAPRSVPSRPTIHAVARKIRRIEGDAITCTLPEGEQRILTAVAQYPEGVERNQISILTGYKRSTRDAYIQRLAGKGLIDDIMGQIVAKQTGIDALGDSFEPLPTGEDLRQYWLSRLPEGEAVILKYITANGRPADYERDEVAAYKRSTRNAYIQRLMARKLVEESGRGMIRAAEILFEGGSR